MDSLSDDVFHHILSFIPSCKDISTMSVTCRRAFEYIYQSNRTDSLFRQLWFRQYQTNGGRRHFQSNYYLQQLLQCNTHNQKQSALQTRKAGLLTTAQEHAALLYDNGHEDASTQACMGYFGMQLLWDCGGPVAIWGDFQGVRIFSGGTKGTFQDRERQVISIADDESHVLCVQSMPALKLLFLGFASGKVVCFQATCVGDERDVYAYTCLSSATKHTNEVTSLCLLPTGGLLSASVDGTVVKYPLASQLSLDQAVTIVQVGNPVLTMATMKHRGRTFILTGDQGAHVSLWWEIADQDWRHSYARIDGHGVPTQSMLCSDGSDLYVVVGDNDGRLLTWRLDDHLELEWMGNEQLRVSSTTKNKTATHAPVECFAVEGNLLLVGAGRHTVAFELPNVVHATPKLMGSLVCHPNPQRYAAVVSCYLDHDRQSCVTLCRDGTLHECSYRREEIVIWKKAKLQQQQASNKRKREKANATAEKKAVRKIKAKTTEQVKCTQLKVILLRAKPVNEILPSQMKLINELSPSRAKASKEVDSPRAQACKEAQPSREESNKEKKFKQEVRQVKGKKEIQKVQGKKESPTRQGYAEDISLRPRKTKLRYAEYDEDEVFADYDLDDDDAEASSDESQLAKVVTGKNIAGEPLLKQPQTDVQHKNKKREAEVCPLDITMNSLPSPTKNRKKTYSASKVIATEGVDTFIHTGNIASFKNATGVASTHGIALQRSALDSFMNSASTKDSMAMRMRIIHAAVQHYRIDSQTFLGVDEVTYDGIEDAFEKHGGILPCSKCGGSYDCRIDKGHTDELALGKGQHNEKLLKKLRSAKKFSDYSLAKADSRICDCCFATLKADHKRCYVCMRWKDGKRGPMVPKQAVITPEASPKHDGSFKVVKSKAAKAPSVAKQVRAPLMPSKIGLAPSIDAVSTVSTILPPASNIFEELSIVIGSHHFANERDEVVVLRFDADESKMEGAVEQMWSCLKCSHFNNTRKYRCSKCKKGSGGPIYKVRVQGRPVPSKVMESVQQRSSSPPREWDCQNCGVCSDGTKHSCSDCGENVIPPASSPNQQQIFRSVAKSQRLESATATTTLLKPLEKKVDTTWSCYKCTYVNGATAFSCQLCRTGRKRAHAVPVRKVV